MDNFKEICKVYGKTFPEIAPQPFMKAMKTVLPYKFDDFESLPWRHIIPKDQQKEFLDKRDQQREDIITEIGSDISYFQEIYPKMTSVFDYLQPAKVDPIQLKLYQMSGEHNQFLGDIKPDANNYLPVPTYNLSDTVTGRMKVTSGPNILLLPKKLRNIFQSRFGKEGSLWYIDFVSLEPRVILSIKSMLSSLIGNPPLDGIIEEFPKDIYSYSLKKLKLSSEIDRDTLKQIVLPQVYGQAKSLTIENLEAKKVRGPDEVVDLVNDFFGIDMIRNYVNQEYNKTGQKYLRTFYGRHLNPDDSKPHALLNYYIQSLAVDIALLGFERICKRLKETQQGKEVIVPIFMLHDALILDVHNKVEHVISKICDFGAKPYAPNLNNRIFYLSGNKL